MISAEFDPAARGVFNRRTGHGHATPKTEPVRLLLVHDHAGVL